MAVEALPPLAGKLMISQRPVFSLRVVLGDGRRRLDRASYRMYHV